MRPRCSLAGVPFLLPLLVIPVLLTASSPVTVTPDAVVAAAADEENDGFTLAVVRRDSIMIPFATYDGKRWKNAWPQPEPHVTAPITLADVPKKWWAGRDPIAKWTLLPIDASDSASRTLETTSPTWYPAHCQQAIGLRTTYSTRDVVPPPRIQPYPKAGLAFSSVGSKGATPTTIEPIQIVDIASSPLVAPLTRTLLDAVNFEESKRIANYLRAGAGWIHPYDDDERRGTPIRLEALYKVARGFGDQDVFYFEGMKYYAVRDANKDAEKSAEKSTEKSAKKPREGSGEPGKDPCDLVTFVSGWVIGREDELLKDNDRIKPIEVTVSVTSCDFASARIMLPLGAVRTKDKTMWAVQWSGWTNEHYSVIEVKDDVVLAVTGGEGGFCARRD